MIIFFLQHKVAQKAISDLTSLYGTKYTYGSIIDTICKFKQHCLPVQTSFTLFLPNNDQIYEYFSSFPITLISSNANIVVLNSVYKKSCGRDLKLALNCSHLYKSKTTQVCTSDSFLVFMNQPTTTHA